MPVGDDESDDQVEKLNGIIDQQRARIEELKKQANGASEVESLKSRLLESEGREAELNEQLLRLQAEIHLGTGAGSDVLKIREAVIEKVLELERVLDQSVKEVMATAEGRTLATYITFDSIQQAYDECVGIFERLQPAILSDLRIYASVCREYIGLSNRMATCKGKPTVSLYKRTLKLSGRLSALMDLQDQLSSGASAGAESKEVPQDIPREWLFTDSEGNNYLIDFYDVLGVSLGALAKDIRKAYRQKSKIFHPDRETGDEGKFACLKAAEQVLLGKGRSSYDSLREKYEKSLATWDFMFVGDTQ